MIPPGLEPGTACVLDRSDNQLHHRTIDGGLNFGWHYIRLDPARARSHTTHALMPRDASCPRPDMPIMYLKQL